MSDVFVGTPNIDQLVVAERFIYGINGDDSLIGQSDEPTQMYGGQGNDFLVYDGGAFAKIYGEDGNDELQGNPHADVLFGGDGADVFDFNTPLVKGNADTIADFEPGVDRIGFAEASMPALGASVSKGEFRIGPKAQDKNDHLIYDSKHGKLFYDDDGKGGEQKILFALIDKHLHLDQHDFTALL